MLLLRLLGWYVGHVGIRTAGEDMLMFEQEEMIVLTSLEQLSLKVVCFSVLNAA